MKKKTKMKTAIRFQIIFLILVLLIGCKKPKEDFWIQDCDKNNIENCGFVDINGEIKIEFGKYQMIFTDTFRTYAIVLKNEEGFVGIGKDEKTLFRIYNYDDGPDYVSESLFRIEKNNKIGFVDYETGKVIIEPKYSGAKPFEKGYSAVCKGCDIKQTGEHSMWINGKWGLIDKTGKEVVESKFDWIKSIDADNRITIIESGSEKQIEIKRTR